ncbi:MAG TPA: peptidylprolyl isomerase [Terriglobales bacterium]|nr:peptidylprolyl isomerase [Terriglobales bacterium]
MRKSIFPLLVVGMLLTNAFAADQVVEQIIARVNNSIITRSDYQRSKEQTLQDIKQSGANLSEAQVNDELKNVLRDLIDQQLLIQKASDLGINADTDLIKQLDEMRKSMKLDSMEALEKAAEAQGISWEDYKQNLKNRILTQKVIEQEVGSRIQVQPEEVQKFYDTHKKELEQQESVSLEEILIAPQTPAADPTNKNAPPPQPTQADLDAAYQRAQEVLAELKKGGKFEDLAKKYSNGPTAAEGGALGEFKRGVLAKELEDKTFALKAGETTDIIRTKQGFVILKVAEHTPGGVPSLAEAQDRIMQALYMQKMQPKLREYLTKLREEAYIDLPVAGYVDSGASPNESKPIYTTTASADDAKAKNLKKKKHFIIF